MKEPWDAFWGQRYAQLATRTARRRPARDALNLVEEDVELGGGLSLSILRPPDADALIDESKFDEQEFLPYWAELWASGVALARHVAALELAGKRVLELGCGLGLPSLAAALRGADVLATDWAEDAIELLRRNAEPERRAAPCRAGELERARAAAARAPWDVVLGADLLYEERNADAARRRSCRGSAAKCSSPSRGGRTRRSSSSSSAPSRLRSASTG